MKTSVWIITGLFLPIMLMANFRMDGKYSSNMVLQRDVPIKFRGFGDAGTEIRGTFMGNTAKAITGEDGRWCIEFPAAKVDHVNYTAVFTDGKENIELKDILIGDVWFCSGQSNMAMTIGAKFVRGSTTINCVEEVKNSTHPELRYVQQRQIPSHKTAREAALNGGTWFKSGPHRAATFSAAAYFFGRKLNQDLNIPIGLIVSAWGGTGIRTWISNKGYFKYGPEIELNGVKKFDMTEPELKKYDEDENNRYVSGALKWYDALYAAKPEYRYEAKDLSPEEMDTTGWKAAVPLKDKTYMVRWYSTKFELRKNQKKDAYLFVSDPGVVCDVWLNGKHVRKYRLDEKSSWYKRSLYIPMKEPLVKLEGENVLTIRTEFPGRQFSSVNYAITRVTSVRKTGTGTHTLRNWLQKEETAFSFADRDFPAFPAFPNIEYKNLQFMSNLYNGQVDSWTEMPIKGVIWYQGCSNNGNNRYYPLHKTLIKDWRDRWGDQDMPFIITQLAGYAGGSPEPWHTYNPTMQAQNYALTREIQSQVAASMKNVGLACTVDIGECQNIHPANKQDVGIRLALEAERIAYGMDVVSRGPVFKKAVPEGKSIRVFYDNAAGLKTSDGKAPVGFAIAGEDKKFVWAEAAIDGENIVVSSEKVPAPKYVRYAYINYHSDLNLQNGAGLPAYPFRSDALNLEDVK